MRKIYQDAWLGISFQKFMALDAERIVGIHTMFLISMPRIIIWWKMNLPRCSSRSKTILLKQ